VKTIAELDALLFAPVLETSAKRPVSLFLYESNFENNAASDQFGRLVLFPKTKKGDHHNGNRPISDPTAC
jgi:hypothetical protein